MADGGTKPSDGGLSNRGALRSLISWTARPTGSYRNSPAVGDRDRRHERWLTLTVTYRRPWQGSLIATVGGRISRSGRPHEDTGQTLKAVAAKRRAGPLLNRQRLGLGKYHGEQ